MAIRLNMLSRMVPERPPAAHQERPARTRGPPASPARAPPSGRSRAPSQSATGSPSIGPIASTSSGTVSAAPTDEAPAEVDELGVRPRVRRRQPLRLQRHAADRAGPRPHLLDLGMHRAGVDRARRHRLRGGPARRRRPPGPPRTSPGSARAEMEVAPGMRMARLAGGRVDGHAADRVADERRRSRHGCVHRGPPQTRVRTPYAASSRWKVKACRGGKDRRREP